MKVIANFLPQYHEIEENNEWWGKGFTEWTNTKKGEKLYKNHYQPIEPKDENYYDLMDKETVKWQTKLAQENAVYGFAYYHYWFCGRKILEKPAENLLKWKEIDQKFCFIWANHDWKRSWEGTSELLIKQEYGNEKDWTEHFYYLNQFFNDERYIKVEDKPLFAVFNSSVINDFDEMIKVWNRLSIENGGKGICVIEIARDKYKDVKVSEESEGIILSEPIFALSNMGIGYRLFAKVRLEINRLYNKKAIKKYGFAKISQISLKYSKKVSTDKKMFLGAFTSWDNSSRHGSRGYVIDGSTPAKFKKYLYSIKKYSEIIDSEFLFINAWNEWCEGMYLEPDKKFGYEYLEAIKDVFADKNDLK